MSHMVIYRNADGKPGYQHVDDLAAAVAFVEKVRNTDGVENCRIYKMEPVHFRFEPYYQVKLDTGEATAGAVRPTVVAVPTTTAPPPVTEAAPVAAAVATEAVESSDDSANGVRRGLFGR